MRLDAIGAVESCYAPVADEEGWLRGVLRALEPLDDGLGLYATRFDTSGPVGVRLDPSVVALNPDEAWIREATAGTLEGDPAVIRATYRAPGPVSLASQRLRRICSAMGIGPVPLPAGRDVLGVFARDVDDRGILIGIPLRRAENAPGPRLRHALGAIAAHLTSARRLRALGPTATSSDVDGAEAILDARGTVAHASGAAESRRAREVLSHAVRAVERARGATRRVAPEEALALWEALVAGTWSLVDATDTDGKRFVLARRNVPGVREPKALTSPERDVLAYAARGHSNKYIAYLLGVRPSTVASQLASASRKLGLRSRSELIRTFAAP